jgi:protein-tyrosine phosphatase
MVDIHTHILPGLDDGAETMEETAEMLEMARASGTRVLAATPHADPQYRFDPGKVSELLAEAQQLAGEGLRLVAGCDFHLSFDNVAAALDSPATYALNGKSYLLMELSDMVIFPNTAELWGRLEGAGLRIVLTHPERNPLLRQRIGLIREWVEQGRLMQVTAQSLTGHFGSKAADFARQMLNEGLVHFVASDAHDVRGRPPRLDSGFEWLTEHYSRRLAELLCEEFPRCAVEGEPLDLKGFPPEGRGRKSFWSRMLGG